MLTGDILLTHRLKDVLLKLGCVRPLLYMVVIVFFGWKVNSAACKYDIGDEQTCLRASMVAVFR